MFIRPPVVNITQLGRRLGHSNDEQQVEQVKYFDRLIKKANIRLFFFLEWAISLT